MTAINLSIAGIFVSKVYGASGNRLNTNPSAYSIDSISCDDNSDKSDGCYFKKELKQYYFVPAGIIIVYETIGWYMFYANRPLANEYVDH